MILRISKENICPPPTVCYPGKIAVDDENLYIGAQLEGDEIWGNVTERDDVIFRDNDFEILLIRTRIPGSIMNLK